MKKEKRRKRKWQGMGPPISCAPTSKSGNATDCNLQIIHKHSEGVCIRCKRSRQCDWLQYLQC